jgi:polyphosphate kinase 2 (PPK2 family)
MLISTIQKFPAFILTFKMAKKYRALFVDISTRELVRNECKKEFLRHHPEFEGMLITDDFIIKKIAEYYLI